MERRAERVASGCLASGVGRAANCGVPATIGGFAAMVVQVPCHDYRV
jgi:hypothetical protein